MDVFGIRTNQFQRFERMHPDDKIEELTGTEVNEQRAEPTLHASTVLSYWDCGTDQ